VPGLEGHDANGHAYDPVLEPKDERRMSTSVPVPGTSRHSRMSDTVGKSFEAN
jgi:hypothetical protein